MESKANRIMCGTCIFWNGRREIIPGTNAKVAILDECGICECPISLKSGETRKRQLKCKEYLNLLDNG